MLFADDSPLVLSLLLACSMHRQPEHVQSFFLAEMGTDGSIDGSIRLVIKGRFQPKQVESLLKKYIGQRERNERRTRAQLCGRTVLLV